MREVEWRQIATFNPNVEEKRVEELCSDNEYETGWWIVGISIGYLIHKHASALGYASEIETMVHLDAIRFLQQREGYTPCFGRDIPLRPKENQPHLCAETTCYWLNYCDTYRHQEAPPIEREYSGQPREELQWLRQYVAEQEKVKDDRLKQNGVGMQILSFNHLPNATRKMLLAAPVTVMGESARNPQSLKAYILKVSNENLNNTAGTITTASIETTGQILYTRDLSRLRAWLTDTRPFLDSGALSYYPLLQEVKETRGYSTKGGPRGPGGGSVYPAVSLPARLDLETFSAPHLGTADGDIRLTDPAFAPILNLELPVLEKISYKNLYKLMNDYPEELCTFQDRLMGHVEEMRQAAIGSTDFGRQCRRIERDLRQDLRKLDADYKSSRINTAVTLMGCAVAGWTLALYCFVNGSDANNILTILGPGGLAYTASAAVTKYFTQNNIELRQNSAYFLWKIGRTERKR